MAKRIITALDIGSSKITTVIAAADDKAVEVIGVANHPSKGIKKGVVVNIDEAISSILQSISGAERMSDITVSSVVTSISGNMITSLNNKGVVAIPSGEVTEDDVFRAVESARTIAVPQGQEILHIIPREFIIDGQTGIKDPLGMSGSRLEVDTHIILAPTTVIKNITKCVQQVSISVDDIVFSGFADSYSVLTDTEKELGVTLVDIGAGTTDIVIFQEGAIAFSTSIPVGGLHITNDIAVGLRLSLEDAEKLKLQFNEIMTGQAKQKMEGIEEPAFQKREKDKSKDERVRSTSDSKDKDVIDLTQFNIQSNEKVSKTLLEKIVKVRVEEIFELARDKASAAGFDLTTPSGIVLVGGAAKLAGITDICQQYLNVVARVGNPVGLSGMTEEINGPEFATVQGLIRYMAESEDVPAQGAKPTGSSGDAPVERVKNFFKSLMP